VIINPKLHWWPSQNC